MTHDLLRLSTGDLQALTSMLRLGRFQFPISAIPLQRVVPAVMADQVSASLNDLSHRGFSSSQIATLCEAVVFDRSSRQSCDEAIELVTTGHEHASAGNRDTGVVVRELFARAESTVLVSGYAVHQGDRVFQVLADRMHDEPRLQVRMFLDIQRSFGETSSDSELVHRFANAFRTRNWPPDRAVPALYYDPRSLQVDGHKRACLHAKCVVVDETIVFVSSANFTEAAQERNIEVGLLIRVPAIATQLTRFFDNLVSERVVQSVL